ncbi:acyl-CoA dehydrogenase family protein [Neobacillus thermocopriae]|uniref:Acyl-CoA/acyl-ACP dehydrogenase n=1 Tax=Neobacillus thermocopriae TaxID=1215031 RepID=A0A6B3TQ10_9BACI|nr:acyl-CoA dehydrogenase family protein [Neobacillus thermocopriae]MED3623801.1 acyl-CoA/acyl-ACP dehydrogenase [Neobacillus thermocopriae]MED3712990.1 acyl-CoA/acyl-ACP dehydrogenase [Neobacillus thermocopriae]NEX79075.1 acyl-CoA/acyl-ACP dehydrogenase [Neobacillus thermocopriae]
MNLFVKSEKQKLWLERLLKKEQKFKENSADIDERAIFPKENIQDLVEMKYSSVTIPVAYGGEGFQVYDMVLMQETLARFDGSTALSMGWNLSVIGEIFERKIWSEEKLNFLAKEVLQGALINRAATEVQTGSPTRGGRPGTTAVKKDGGWVLTGRKTFTTMSPMLTYFLTSAWIEEKQRIGFFLLHKDLPGLSIEETWDVISMRGTASHDLVLDHVIVDDSMLVELPDAPRSEKVNGWLLHIPACYLGIAQAARDYAVFFANNHSPNSLNGPISQLANVQQLLGEIDLELIRARHLIYSVAATYDDELYRKYIKNEIGVVKHTITNSAIKIVDKAMRVVGAKSLQRSNPLQRYYRDVRAGLHNPPMDDMTIKKLALSAIEEGKQKHSS